MRYTILGRTGLKVSELCFGAMTFGGSNDTWKAIGGVDEKGAAGLVARCLDAGINFFDTANGYSDGQSEILLGKALGTRRRDVLVATKVGFPVGTGPNDKGLGRAHVMRACEDSLRRLGTDWIDLYIAHRRDPSTPLEETMRALDDLVRAGKVRYVAASNFPAWQLMKANALADRHGGARFECLQAYYNLAARDIEREIIPLLHDEGIGLMAWSPLASGALTGKYGRDGTPPAGARRGSFEIGPLDWGRVHRILEVLRELASSKSASVAQVALAWLLHQPVVSTVILGARRMDQLEDNLGCVEVSLAPVELERLAEASALPDEYPGWYLRTFDGL